MPSTTRARAETPSASLFRRRTWTRACATWKELLESDPGRHGKPGRDAEHEPGTGRTSHLCDGCGRGAQNLDDVKQGLDEIAKSGQRVSAFLRDMHKEWTKPTALSTSIVKLGAQVIGGQIRDAASAIAEPAKTSYSQALAKATEYRTRPSASPPRRARATPHVGEQIDATARRLGILPGRVSDYSRSVRQLTGDWQGDERPGCLPEPRAQDGSHTSKSSSPPRPRWRRPSGSNPQTT